MIALLRYAALKTSRDGSLWAFLFAPVFMPVAALFGGSLAFGLSGFHYPLVMEHHMSAVQNANLVGTISTVICSVFGALPAFWTLRAEVASRAVGSLTMAARPLAIAATLVVFAATLAILAWLMAMSAVGLLTTALPANMGVLALKIVIASVTTASFGALAVMISPEPPMIIAMFAASAVVIPWFEKTKVTPILIVPLVVAVICTTICAYLLERRCAR